MPVCYISLFVPSIYSVKFILKENRKTHFPKIFRTHFLHELKFSSSFLKFSSWERKFSNAVDWTFKSHETSKRSHSTRFSHSSNFERERKKLFKT